MCETSETLLIVDLMEKVHWLEIDHKEMVGISSIFLIDVEEKKNTWSYVGFHH